MPPPLDYLFWSSEGRQRNSPKRLTCTLDKGNKDKKRLLIENTQPHAPRRYSPLFTRSAYTLPQVKRRFRGDTDENQKGGRKCRKSTQINSLRRLMQIPQPFVLSPKHDWTKVREAKGPRHSKAYRCSKKLHRHSV